MQRATRWVNLTGHQNIPVLWKSDSRVSVYRKKFVSLRATCLDLIFIAYLNLGTPYRSVSLLRFTPATIFAFFLLSFCLFHCQFTIFNSQRWSTFIFYMSYPFVVGTVFSSINMAIISGCMGSRCLVGPVELSQYAKGTYVGIRS